MKTMLIFAAAAAFIQSVYGGVKLEGKLYSDEPTGKRTFPWTLVFNDNGSYNLKTTMINPDGTFVWLETGSDGMDAYHLKRPTTLEDKQGTNEFGFVTKGPFPQSHYGLGQTIWLALASGPFIKSNGIAKLPPLSAFQMNQALYPKITSSGKTFSAPPNLPKNVNFEAPPYILNPENKKVWQGIRNHVAGEFKTTSTTNLNGYLLPLTFEFVRYLPPGVTIVNTPKTNKTSSVVYTRYLGVVEKVQINPNQDSASMLPAITCKDVRVLDYRFPDKEGGVRGYTIDDAKWLNRNDAKLRN